MLRIDPEEGEEDGETKQVKIKIDQNLFTYPSARPPAGQARGSSKNETPSSSFNNVSPRSNSHNSLHAQKSPSPYYTVVTQPQSTPVAKVNSNFKV